MKHMFLFRCALFLCYFNVNQCLHHKMFLLAQRSDIKKNITFKIVCYKQITKNFIFKKKNIKIQIATVLNQILM